MIEQILISPKLLSLFLPTFRSILIRQKEGKISGKKISRKMNNYTDERGERKQNELEVLRFHFLLDLNLDPESPKI